MKNLQSGPKRTQRRFGAIKTRFFRASKRRGGSRRTLLSCRTYFARLSWRSQMTEFDDPEDPSWLHDLDWIEVNNLRRAYKEGGDDALDRAWRDLLDKDAIQFARVACAYMPDNMPQRIKEAVEKSGYTLQELIDLAKKRQH